MRPKHGTVKYVELGVGARRLWPYIRCAGNRYTGSHLVVNHYEIMWNTIKTENQCSLRTDPRLLYILSLHYNADITAFISFTDRREVCGYKKAGEGALNSQISGLFKGLPAAVSLSCEIGDSPIFLIY
jgi:hypothetical protein